MSIFNIDSIWIEYEFILPSSFLNYEGICQSILDAVNKDSKFLITLDREFYNEQIEFKLMRTDDMVWGIAHFQEFIWNMYKTIPNLSSTTDGHYVWTHIHLFINKNWVPYTKFAQWKKIPLVKYAYGCMSEWLVSSSLFWIKSRVIRNELSRMTRNHNILRYFDWKIGNVLKRNLESERVKYQQFHDGTDKPKYSPVLWSLPSIITWKPHSLEIRCIPNTYLLVEDPENISNYIKWVEHILNNKVTTTKENDIKEIADSHMKMLRMSMNM